MEKIEKRMSTCFMLSILLTFGAYAYCDLALDIQLYRLFIFWAIWIGSIVIMASLMTYTGLLDGYSTGGDLLKVILAPASLLALLMLGLWCGLLPVKEEKTKQEIGGSVI